MRRVPGRNQAVPGQKAYLARLSGIIMILPSSMAAGWLLGYYLVDTPLEIYPWGSIILTLLGAGAGFYEVIRVLDPGRK